MQQCTRTIKADVVAIPQPIMLNRLGATIPNAFVFALKGDTIPDGSNIQLRPGKRPRPLVLRANVGDCLCINICVSNIGEVSLVQHEVITNLIRW
jgi:hypothetical protein